MMVELVNVVGQVHGHVLNMAASTGTAPSTAAGGTAGGGPLAAAKNAVTNQVQWAATFLIGAVALFFLLKHEYNRLIAFLVISLVVFMLIFDPAVIKNLATSLGNLLGGSGSGTTGFILWRPW